ncbi:MAG: Gfo/Idh/MocA family oxidoreductase [Candidatus Heimdallarchaeota archaeon]|nr:Gfo/Idh/MocA family oxidoreductase [Candidatus Heimdallarchaeota archaeon]
MKKLRIGIIGCGAITELKHIPTLKRTAIFDIKKIADLDIKIIEKIKKKYKVDAEATTDYRELLEDDDLDAVLIATPPAMHEKMIIDSFEKGKHVFCEKPLTINLEEAKRIVKKMEETSRTLFIGYHQRFIPQFNKLKELSEKKIGKLISLQSIICANAYAWPTKSKDDFKIDIEKGGGVMAEMGTHHIDLVSWIMGKPKKVWCKLDYMDKKSPVYDQATLFITFEGGGNAHINMGWRDFKTNYISIFGTEGHAFTTAEKPRILISVKGLVGQPPLVVKAKVRGSPFQEEWLYFNKAITSGKNPLYTKQDILAPIAIVDSAYESIKNNSEFVQIGEKFL